MVCVVCGLVESCEKIEEEVKDTVDTQFSLLLVILI